MRRHENERQYTADEHGAIVRLACAIIEFAINDLRGPHNCATYERERIRESARQFLIGDDMDGWADVAGVSPDAIRRGLKVRSEI